MHDLPDTGPTPEEQIAALDRADAPFTDDHGTTPDPEVAQREAATLSDLSAQIIDVPDDDDTSNDALAIHLYGDPGPAKDTAPVPTDSPVDRMRAAMRSAAEDIAFEGDDQSSALLHDFCDFADDEDLMALFAKMDAARAPQPDAEGPEGEVWYRYDPDKGFHVSGDTLIVVQMGNGEIEAPCPAREWQGPRAAYDALSPFRVERYQVVHPGGHGMTALTPIPEYASTTTLARIRAAGPCLEGWTKLLNGLADDEPLDLLTVLDINGLDDALWVLSYAMPDKRLARHFQAWCAEQVLPLFEAEHPDDGRVRAQIAILRNDDATLKGRAAARDAAWAAAWDAASPDASAAAWAAAWAAASAAAWDAASDAESPAASAATSAAAWAAASAAASPAARDAARAAQERQLRRMLAATKQVAA